MPTVGGQRNGRARSTRSTTNTTSSAGSQATLAIIQGLTGGYNKLQEGKSKRALAKTNRFIADLEAQDALDRGQEKEAIARGETKKLVGSQRASFGAQGVRLGVGSAQDVQQEALDIGELDAVTIKNNARREAFGIKREASAFDFSAKRATSAAKTEAGTTFLTGAARTTKLF